MQVTYELAQKDFFESFVAHRNRNTITKWFIRLLVSVLLLVSALGLIGVLLTHDSQMLSNFAPLFALLVVWAVLLWGTPWWAARRQFTKQPAAHGAKTVLLDSLGVHWRWNGGSSDVEWRNFIRWVESKNEFLLYSSPACFNIVPKRAFTSEQLAEMRSFLSDNICAQQTRPSPAQV
jgi:YcxB-like protein